MANPLEPSIDTDTRAEQSVHDVILEMLGDDSGIAEDVRDAVLEVLAEVVGDIKDDTESAVTQTYLSSISVVGFRGVGRQARLDLFSAPGLTVVSGRNGSGKSSFAEALELALTGTSYRWHNKQSTLWTESWRNLHHPDPCSIRAHFTTDSTGPFAVGRSWKSDAELTDGSSWTKYGAADAVDGTDHLGWARPLELWRPILSYDELGGLFDGGPSALYDALDKLLGLEVLAAAEKLLAAQLKSTKTARGQADDERKRLLVILSDSTDERAQRARALLRKKGVALDEVLALAIGADDARLNVVPALRDLADLEAPNLDEIESVAGGLRAAAQNLAHAAGGLADSTRHRVDLLQAALRFHDHDGDTECPVCGQGALDGDWAAQARGTIAASETAMSEYRSAAAELTDARSAAIGMLAELRTVEQVTDVEISALAAYNEAVSVSNPAPTGDAELASHLESALVAVAAAADLVRVQAEAALRLREDSWAPLAAQIGGWVPLEESARTLDGTVKTLTAAKKWITEHAVPFRNMRLEPIAAQARKIWGQLRQESNVDLGDITLEGTATRRRANLGGSVDGQPTKALTVMSQGELHALALALFLPRATSINSPFRFVVLDDPIQAMDPAKIDGFVQVLSDIAKTHQVIVFSHDDRLASVIRETGIDARLIEVVREAESKVTARDNLNPALRAVNDVYALIKDERLPDDIRARVLPGMFRIAVEAAAKQAFYTKQALAGRPRAEFEDDWTHAKKTGSKLALAVHGDASADLKSWLDAKAERRRTFFLCNAVHTEALGITAKESLDLRRTVRTILALR